MAFDDQTRNRLSKFVGDVRELLSEEFAYQLQNVYGLDPDTGDITDVDSLPTLSDADRQTAEILRELFEHYLANVPNQTKTTASEILDRIVREQAFTVLNRLCAIRMAEARDLVVEAISEGYQSKGFQLYSRLAGHALGETGEAYVAYLSSVFDECALDLPVLFDRFDEHGRLFPRESVLLKVLDAINHHDLIDLWAEDETIGWIYQYFNSKEERKAMRDASQAPRNSRELAVRNQFFTPRYVVEFLTDNTLGRIWYEMRKGETRLKDECQYLVRRPNELFLVESEQAPRTEAIEQEEDLSQEELLNRPVHISHRPLKDPREIRMLDPACGSMHFGLYAFDLYLRIYEEYWDLVASVPSAAIKPADLPPLTEGYESRDAFLRDVPRLIIHHNIHGIDIDPRAVQIAGLSLWLRAQRAWKSQGLAARERPQVERSNVVCAEPMPGDKQQLQAFCKELHPATAQMVTAIFEEMKLAGEAGSLLKIEQKIKLLIATAKGQWQQQPQETQMQLFDKAQVIKEQQLEFDLSGITDERFFEKAEEKIYEALRKYASETSDGGFRRKLFAGDAERGFAFINQLNYRYDAILMNPPFGEFTPSTSRAWLSILGNHNANDMYAAFVLRATQLITDDGAVGAITSRSGYFMGAFKKWRSDLFSAVSPTAYCDLGYGVLDALVEVSCYVLSKSSTPIATFINCLSDDDKAHSLSRTVHRVSCGDTNNKLFLKPVDDFNSLPSSELSYWLPTGVLRAFRGDSISSANWGMVRQGLSSGDDFRFLRLAWEVPPDGIGNRWALFAKGGEYSPFYDDVHLVVEWGRNAKQLWACTNPKTGKLRANIWMLGATIDNCFFRGGWTYTKRTTSGFTLKALPRGVAFSDQAMSLFLPQHDDACQNADAAAAVLLSRTGQLFIEAQIGLGDAVHSGSAARRYTQAIIHNVPVPQQALRPSVSGDVQSLALTKFNLALTDETTRWFTGPAITANPTENLKDSVERYLRSTEDAYLVLLETHYALDATIDESTHYDLTTALGEWVFPHPCSYDALTFSEDDLKLLNLDVDDLISIAKERLGSARFLTKKVFVADRRLELICHILRAHPKSVINARRESGTLNKKLTKQLCEELLSFLVGVAFRRFGEPRELANVTPWDVPPNVAPISDPAVAREVLVDDAGNESDIVQCTIDSAAHMYSESIGDMLAEIESHLGYSLRTWIVKHFFSYHFQQYCKARRQAPIYWPISTESGSYTLWFYYHRLTDQTLYKAVNDFVDPKLRDVRDQVSGLRNVAERSSGQEDELSQLSELESELTDFRDSLLESAGFWKPNLNDGVQITAAPLWKFFRLSKWRSKLKKTWEELESGKYDWAHLALSIWPDRVIREKCMSDRSIAIAHDLEEQLWHEVEVRETPKTGRAAAEMEWQPRDLNDAELDAIVAEVKAR